MNAIVSGLINIETTLKVRGFPINYYPVDYPFFGIQSSVSGVGYNVAKALLTLGNNIELASFIADDEEGHIKLHSTESGQFCKERVPDGLAV